MSQPNIVFEDHARQADGTDPTVRFGLPYATPAGNAIKFRT